MQCGEYSVVQRGSEGREVQGVSIQSVGGPEGAKNGTLAIMCGGEQATFDAATPVLEAMGQYVVRLGGPGSGSGAKVLLLARLLGGS